MSPPDLKSLTLAPAPSLSSLPTELHLAIISYITFPTTQLLRQTCRHFHALIPPLDTVEALLLVEKSEAARVENIFACVVCVRLRRTDKFADAFRKGRWDRDGDKRHTRFCINCGTRPPRGADPRLRYRKGECWTRFGIPYVFCKGCRSVKRAAKERTECEVCPQCSGKGKGRK